MSTSILALLAINATLRWWGPDGEQRLFYQGVVRLKECHGSGTIGIGCGGSGVIDLPRTWNNFSSHKLKTKNSKARVIVIVCDDSSRIQLTVGITDKSDPGKAAAEFFRRVAASNAINNI